DQAQARRDAAAHPADADAQIRVADIEMSLGNAEEAFDRLLGVIRRTSGEDRDKVRLHLVGLFEMFPPRDPRVTKARSTLASLPFGVDCLPRGRFGWSCRRRASRRSGRRVLPAGTPQRRGAPYAAFGPAAAA